MERETIENQVAASRCRPKPRRGWFSLRFKFILWVISVVMYLCLALGFLFVHLTQTNVRDDLRRRGASLAASLARKSSACIISGETGVLASLVRSTVEDEDVLFAAVRDTEGAVLASAGTNAQHPADESIPPTGDYAHGEADGKIEVIEIVEPMTTQLAAAPWYGTTSSGDGFHNRQLGTVCLRLSTESEGAAVAMISRQLAPLMLVSCALSIIGTVLVERKITRPVREMVRATKAIASGDLSLRVTAGSPDEIGELAESFNKMADALHLTLHKLEDYSHSLEDKVHQRTKELEANTWALQRANAELEKLDRLKSEFISNVSHELRTPLTSIKAVAEILGRQGQKLPSEQTLEFLNIIESQTDRLTRLISEILDLSHLDHEGSMPKLQPTSLQDVISEAVDSVRGIAAERGVGVTVALPHGLPPALCERDKAIQVVVNLLGNALKYTPEGGTITVSARLLDGSGAWRGSPRPVSGIVVSVADTGPGIPREQLDAIFDRFRQIKSAAWGKPIGSGLGLSISREIVERFGGTIWAESELGEGSVFHFTMEPAEDVCKKAA